VRWSAKGVRSFTSAGGNAETAAKVNPIAAGPCVTVDATDDPGAATYRLRPASGAGFTLLGAPTVIARLAVRGTFAQVAARLWDVAPDGTQTLVTQSLYRPRLDNRNRQVFQLHPNGWHFAAGHVPKLELLGQSVPYGRTSTGTFKVKVSQLQVRLPVHETPDEDAVRTPAKALRPPKKAEKLDTGPRRGKAS
jgi:predicted acyl esterase